MSTNTKPKHSPPPWPEPRKYTSRWIGPYWHIPDVARFRTEADARLAWRAVNCHEELVFAADEALNVLIGCCIPAGGCDDRKAILNAQSILRAILAKARPESTGTEIAAQARSTDSCAAVSAYDPHFSYEDLFRLFQSERAKTEELIAVLEDVLGSAHPNAKDHPVMFLAWQKARAILAKARPAGKEQK